MAAPRTVQSCNNVASNSFVDSEYRDGLSVERNQTQDVDILQHDESGFSREAPPSKLGERRVFDDNLKHAVWELANEFPGTSNILKGMYKAHVPKDKITLLVIEAISLRAKSAATMKSVAKHVSALVRFYLGTREETKFQLTGDDSIILLHDYLESLAERGRTVPATAKHALSFWAEALGIDWPLTHNLVCSAAIVAPNESSKKAPAMSLKTLRAIEEVALNMLVTQYKRAFAAGILLMTYASLRFPDVQRIRSFELNEDSVHGTLPNCKTKASAPTRWLERTIEGTRTVLALGMPPRMHNWFSRLDTSDHRHAGGL